MGDLIEAIDVDVKPEALFSTCEAVKVRPKEGFALGTQERTMRGLGAALGPLAACFN